MRTNFSSTKYFIILFFIVCAAFLSLQASKIQNVFAYRNVPEQYKKSKGVFGKSSLFSKKIENASYPILRSLPVGYDTKGKVDYTDLIQSALDTHNNVIFPEFPLFINAKGLSIKSHSQVYFKKGSKLLMEPNAKQNYEVLRLHGVTNVAIFSPTIIGDRDAHLGSTGEWGFGISIRGSQKVKIYNAIIKNCWGDGIYLGSYGSLVNTDITIDNCFLDNNRRNGISIISGNNMTISNTLISNTNGTAPMSGIDLEPNNNNEYLKNIALKNIITFNNRNEGILVVLRALYGKNDKYVTIAIENHLDDNSGFAMGFAFPKANADFKKIEGNVTITNSIWKDNTFDLVRFHDNNYNSVNVKFVRPKIINKDGNFSQKKKEEFNTKYKKITKISLVE